MIKAPFPWFGGKSRAAAAIWQRFGNTPNYVEPFAGSLAVLLQRPHEAKTESVNDIDCYLSNFWRALQAEPEAVAQWADWPVNEADLHARHLWLIGRAEFRERMKADQDFYDCKIAGWWVWGICQWIGSGWCHSDYYADETLPASPSRQLPHMGNAGMGIHRPSQQLPHMGDAGMGDDLHSYLYSLSDRLRRVRVACGDWTRVLGDSVTFRHGVTGILLDPPYSHDERQDDLYANDNDVAADVRQWAIENGNNHLMRIALCCYADEHSMPPDWTLYQWKARGGYGSQGNGTGRDNASRECIWFSPHCIRLDGQARQGKPADFANLPMFAEVS
jgi:DNA adenine methylase